MKHRTDTTFLLALLGLACLTACAPNHVYRDRLDRCAGPDTGQECRRFSVQEHGAAASADNYLLGFVELNDQGHMHDRHQLQVLMQHLEKEVETNDLLLVVFVHGWHHNAGFDQDNGQEDMNVEKFRGVLKRMSTFEALDSRKTGHKRRKVAGVYVGWRGESVDVPLLKDLTFWDRKNTADKVGHGAVTEVMTRLDRLRRFKNRADGKNDDNLTRLIVIGHSFGGAVVQAALSQIMMERFVQKNFRADTSVCNTGGFGDLVVLLNPAFEASLYKPLRDMAAGCQSYSASQLPVLAILTSESDWATRYTFPIGRGFSTLFEDYSGDSSWSADRNTVGHHEDYITHDLEYVDYGSAVPAPITTQQDYSELSRVLGQWVNDKAGGHIPFPGSELIRRERSTARNPYLVVRVHKQIIPDHNEIYGQRVMDFLRHLILLSAHTSTPAQRVKMQSAQ